MLSYKTLLIHSINTKKYITKSIKRFFLINDLELKKIKNYYKTNVLFH